MAFELLLGAAAVVAGAIAAVAGFGIGSILTPALALETGTILAAAAEFTGWMRKLQWGRRAAWLAGALSGVLGGLVGNQGGIRAAAMLGFGVPKEAFVPPATAIALFVDLARLPVYLAVQWREIARIWPLVAIATAGVVIGTAFGTRLLGRLP